MIFDSSLGIDFKPDHLILTYLKRSFGKIRLVDFGIYPIPPESQKEQREAQAIGLINTFISKHQIKKENISISIPREKVIVRFIKFPLATKENLRKVIEYETPKYAPFEKGEVYFDYVILKEEKEWLHLFVVFVKKDEVDLYLSLLKKIGIQPISIQISSTAASNLFFYHQGSKRTDPVVLLDIADSFYEMNLFSEKHLRESFHMPLPHEDKALKIVNTFKRSGLKGDSLSKMNFFVYGLSAEEGILTSLKATDQIQGAYFPPLNRIHGGMEKLTSYKIYSSIGVPLKGLTKTHLDLNLLPFEMRKKVRQIAKPLFITLVSLAFILSVTWAIGVFTRYRNELNAINAEIKKRKPEVEAIDRIQKQKDGLEKEISELDKIKFAEVSKIEILRELTQLLPDKVWIWNFKYNGKEIEISGFADSASGLISLLDKSPLFEKVEFLAPVTKEVLRGIRGEDLGEKERFKIKAKLEARKS